MEYPVMLVSDYPKIIFGVRPLGRPKYIIFDYYLLRVHLDMENTLGSESTSGLSLFGRQAARITQFMLFNKIVGLKSNVTSKRTGEGGMHAAPTIPLCNVHLPRLEMR